MTKEFNLKKFVDDLLFLDEAKSEIPFDINYIYSGFSYAPELCTQRGNVKSDYWINVLGISPDTLDYSTYHRYTEYRIYFAVNSILRTIAEKYSTEEIYRFSKIDERVFERMCRIPQTNIDYEDFVKTFLEIYPLKTFLRTEDATVIGSIPANYVVEHYDEIKRENLNKLAYIKDLPCDFIAKRPSRFNWGNLSLNHDITKEFYDKFSNKIIWNMVGSYNKDLVTTMYYDKKKDSRKSVVDIIDEIKKVSYLKAHRQCVEMSVFESEYVAECQLQEARFHMRYALFAEAFLKEMWDGSVDKGYFENFCSDYIDTFFFQEAKEIKAFLALYPFSTEFLEENMEMFVSRKCGKAAKEAIERNKEGI